MEIQLAEWSCDFSVSIFEAEKSRDLGFPCNNYKLGKIYGLLLWRFIFYFWKAFLVMPLSMLAPKIAQKSPNEDG